MVTDQSETEQTKSTDERARELDGFLDLFTDTAKAGRSLPITGIFVLLILYTLYFAAPVLVPITMALLLSMLLSPAVDRLEAIYVPRALGSALVVIGAIAIFAGIVLVLAGPAQEWLQKLPGSFYKIESKLRPLMEPIKDIKQAAEQIESATDLGPEPTTREVTIKRPGLTELLLSGTPQVAAAIGVVIILLYFLLSSGDSFLRKTVAVLPTFDDKKRAVEIIRNIKSDISFFLVSITGINVALGICVSVASHYLGVPNPMLWGALVTLLSFAPYVGPTAVLIILSLVGMLTFNDLFEALTLPLIFLFLVIVVQNLIVPIALGRRLLLSPVAIFVAIIIWGWMWGILGALVAVPLLASVKIVCERIEPLRPVAEFLTP